MISNDLIYVQLIYQKKIERVEQEKKKKDFLKQQLKVPNLLKLSIFQKEDIKHQME